MNKLGILLAVGMALVCSAACRADSKTTIRDSMGRITATVTTDRNGNKTIRDSLGRLQGTETTDRNGKTTFRDGSGRLVGTRKVQ